MKEDLTDFLFQTGEGFRLGPLFIYQSLVWSVAIGKGIKADLVSSFLLTMHPGVRHPDR
jgi:hypothetical protein